jgi:enediyne biosynthesis protein E4
MEMFDGVGRRRDESHGEFLNIGQHGLNGSERDCLFRNNGDGTFTDVAYVNTADRIEDGRGLSIFDYDADGHQDVLLRNYRQPAQLLRNRGGRGHWLALKLIGTRSNRDAVGARVRLRTARGLQTRQVSAGSGYLSGHTLVQHFGLGDQTRAALEVAWPSGTRTTLADLAGDRRYTLREGDGEARVQP